jgi:hypothetical protein
MDRIKEGMSNPGMNREIRRQGEKESGEESLFIKIKKKDK